MGGEIKKKLTQSFERGVLFLKRYERHLSGAAFIFGFALDSLLLPRIDSGTSYTILALYIFLVMVSILFAQLYDAQHFLGRRLGRVAPLFLLIIQFFLGSLMSAIFVYYSRSASLIASAPFMILLLTIFIGNEIARDHLKRLELQIATLFFVIFMGMTFAVPVALGMMGPRIFLLSGICATLSIALYLALLAFFLPAIIARAKRVLIGSIGGILLFMNLLYFTALIPPIPLSLRAGDVYHSVARTGEGLYVAVAEKKTIRERLTHIYPVVHVTGAPLYFFTSVFAPTAFATSIVHEWQYYDEDHWVTRHRIAFSISGGRSQGYRGYTIGDDIIPGRWRVRVETPRGELLGSTTFTAVAAQEPVQVEEHILE